jgi:hypothetical protein
VQKETAERLIDVMAVDQISEFEVRTGKSYKENTEQENLMMLAHSFYSNKIRAESLKNQGDVCWGMTLDEYIDTVVRYGFEQVLCDVFTSEKWKHEDRFFIFWHPKGLLLSFDTWGGKSVNGGKVYYNWKPETENRYTSSGSYCDGIWCGDHDCREGLIANMTAMESAGEFLPVWWHCPSLWLLSYADHETCCTGPIHTWTSKEKTAERVSRLPEHVQNAIRGQKSSQE